MKTETCLYSGYKIYPGHGRRNVRTDGKVQIFLNAKCERSYRMKRNPRETCWTVLYRRKHKKGTMAEEITKKRTRKSHKFQRAVGTMSLAEIMAKRNQKPEVRAAQREQAVRAAKEKVKAVKTAKKAEKLKASAKQKQQQTKTKAAKPMKTAAPRIGGKR